MSDDGKKDPKIGIGIVMGTGAGGFRFLTGAGAAEIKYPVRLPPNFTGRHGRGWKVDTDAMLKLLKKDKAHDGAVGTWIVEAPWAHPIWHSYLIAAIHLRDIPGTPAPTITLPGATHQFWAFALDPEAALDDAIRGRMDRFPILQPQNHAEQIICPSDEAAIRLFEFTIQEICDGVLNPDTDARAQWTERFGADSYRKRNGL